MKIVDICHNQGVNDVYVSGIPYRRGLEKKVGDTNNFIRTKEFVNDFIFINNMNIKYEHLAWDGVHLNRSGTMNIANNFIRAINGRRGR